MKIIKTAIAGTLESSDAQITVEPGNGTTIISIDSTVMHQYGRQIKAVVQDTLDKHSITSAKVSVVDKGSLDCTIRARTECAIYRAADFEGNIPWGGTTK